MTSSAASTRRPTAICAATRAEWLKQGLDKQLDWKLPDDFVAGMEEQFSGSCTLEIAAMTKVESWIAERKRFANSSGARQRAETFGEFF